jgi:hypothetical protein
MKKQFKYAVGQVVTVETVDGYLVKAKIVDTKMFEGQPDYLCRPVEPIDNLCGCDGADCCGSNWFLTKEIKG